MRTGRFVALAVVAAAALVAGSCGGDSSEPPKPSATTTTAPPVAPLTGLPDPSGASQRRAALSVKVDNTPAARPQSGVASADVVYEEVVEGGITRLWLVFGSAAPEDVGPIRSVRRMDPLILTPIGGVAAYSGGTPQNVALVQAAPVVSVDEDNAGDAFYRSRERRAPHNLYGVTEKLFARGGEPVPPRPLFTYRPAGAPVVGEPVLRATLGFDPGYVPTYAWDGATGTWKRSIGAAPFVDADGTQVAPRNVVIQFVRYDGLGGEGELLGEGEAWVLAGGALVRGRWVRTDPAQPTQLLDAAGAPIGLVPGRTWVELLPVGARVDLVGSPPAT